LIGPILSTRLSQFDDRRQFHSRHSNNSNRQSSFAVYFLSPRSPHTAPFKYVFAPQAPFPALLFANMSTTIDVPLLSRPLDVVSALKWTSLAVVAYLVIRLLLSGRRGSRLPPGPPTLPILGNIHQIPLERSFLQYFPRSRLPRLGVQRLMGSFTKWARQYGPVFSLKVGSGTIIVLSDGDSVKQVLDKQSAVSSSRPPFHIGNEVITHGNHLGVMPYGDDWRVPPQTPISPRHVFPSPSNMKSKPPLSASIWIPLSLP